MKKLDAFKAAQETDMPTKIVKETTDILANFTFQRFNNMVVTFFFTCFKKASKYSKENCRSVSVCLTFLKYMNIYYSNK